MSHFLPTSTLQGLAIDITEVGPCPKKGKTNGTEHSVQAIVDADVQSQKFKRCKITLDEEAFHCGNTLGNASQVVKAFIESDPSIGSEILFYLSKTSSYLVSQQVRKEI